MKDLLGGRWTILTEELVHLASQFLYELLLCVNFPPHYLDAAVGCFLAFRTLFEAFRALIFHVVALIVMLSEFFSWEIGCAALHRTRYAEGTTILLNVGNQFFIGHLSFVLVAFQGGTPLEDGLFEEFPQNAVKRADSEGSLAEWAFILSFALPVVDTALAENVVTVAALDGVKDEHQANVALEVLRALPLCICGL